MSEPCRSQYFSDFGGQWAASAVLFPRRGRQWGGFNNPDPFFDTATGARRMGAAPLSAIVIASNRIGGIDDVSQK
jgi:hypothetical protein